MLFALLEVEVYSLILPIWLMGISILSYCLLQALSNHIPIGSAEREDHFRHHKIIFIENDSLLFFKAWPIISLPDFNR